MIEKLKQLEELKQQERAHQQAQNAKPENIIAKLVENKADDGVLLDLLRPDNNMKIEEMSISCAVVEKIMFEPNEVEMLSEKKMQWSKKLNNVSQMNHHLLARYLGISIQNSLKSQKQYKEKKGQEDGQVRQQKGDKIEVKAQPLKQLKKEEKSDSKELKEQQRNKKVQISISLLTEPNLKKFDGSHWKQQAKTKKDFLTRIVFCRQLIQSIAFIHSKDLSFFPQKIENLLYVTPNSMLKLLTHKVKSWRDTTERQVDEIKKKQSTKIKSSSLVGKSTKYVAPEFVMKNITIKDIRCNDVWKIGIFIFQLLSGGTLSKEVLQLENIDEDKASSYKIVSQQMLTKLKKQCKGSLLAELSKTLHFVPSQRKELKELLKDFQEIESELGESFTEKTIKAAQKKYIQEEEKHTVKFMLELSAKQEILTEDHKKKLADYFKKEQQRIVKRFQPILRASHSKFSTRCFYEATEGKKQLLIIIQEKNKKKIIFFAQESFDLTRCNGIFGGYIKDPKKKSFIWSPQQNQFCRLKNSQRALGVSYTQGPVIGDGDISISDGGLYNTCRFPQSYQPSGKLKKLLKAEKFELQQYDVYQLTF